MSRRKLPGLALSAVLLLTVTLAPAWSVNARKPLSFTTVRIIQMRLGTLLPSWRLANVWAAHNAYVRQNVKTIASADTSAFGNEAGKVNFNPGPYPKPYSTEAENRAMFELGVMAAYAHFSMVNAYAPDIKEAAEGILKSLAGVAQNTGLSDMSGEFNGVLQAVSDPSYQGGPSKTLDRFDTLANTLAGRVLHDYYQNGFWYYAAGLTLGSLSLVPPTDKFNAPYFRDQLAVLYDHYPTPDLSFDARHDMALLLRSSEYCHFSIHKGPSLAWRAITDIYPFGK